MDRLSENSENYVSKKSELFKIDWSVKKILKQIYAHLFAVIGVFMLGVLITFGFLLLYWKGNYGKYNHFSLSDFLDMVLSWL